MAALPAVLCRRTAASVLAAALAALTTPAIAAGRPITETDIFRFTWVADPQISPDGRRVAFVRVTVNEKKDGYDTALLINVLEHLQDDRAAVRKARSELRMDGTLVIFVPAFGLLMSDLDRRLGHYRRYTTASLRKLLEGAGFTLSTLRYYNLGGFLGWLWRFRMRGHTEQSPELVRFFDRRILPLQLRVERVLELPVGQSVYAVAKKR